MKRRCHACNKTLPATEFVSLRYRCESCIKQGRKVPGNGTHGQPSAPSVGRMALSDIFCPTRRQTICPLCCGLPHRVNGDVCKCGLTYREDT